MEGKWAEGYRVELLLLTAVVAGAVAGNIAVAGILTTDKLVAVQPVNVASPNLVAEFEITADGIINNTGGTSTATQVVLVIWQRAVNNDAWTGVPS